MCNESMMSAKELAILFMNNISDYMAYHLQLYWIDVYYSLPNPGNTYSRIYKFKQNMPTAFRPETDGQTKKTNSTLEQYLRMYCNYQQNNWAQRLPTAEFSYNNHYQASTKCSPFFANYTMKKKSLNSLNCATLRKIRKFLLLIFFKFCLIFLNVA